MNIEKFVKDRNKALFSLDEKKSKTMQRNITLACLKTLLSFGVLSISRYTTSQMHRRN